MAKDLIKEYCLQNLIKMENEIIGLLKQKACAKQDVYRKTQAAFSDLQKLLKAKSERLSKKISDKDQRVKVVYSSKGKFEAQLKFSGDTLLFHMHSNVFDFPTTPVTLEALPPLYGPIDRHFKFGISKLVVCNFFDFDFF